MRSEKQLFQKIDKIILENAEIYNFGLIGKWSGYSAFFFRLWRDDSESSDILASGRGKTRREAMESMLVELEKHFDLIGDNFLITK